MFMYDRMPVHIILGINSLSYEITSIVNENHNFAYILVFIKN